LGDADVLGAPKHLVGAVIQRPKRDADGNVLGGVRLPDVAVPLGVHAAQQEPKSFSCALAGAFLPFPQAKIVERYKDRDDYVNRIRQAARALQAEGFLLAEDAAVIINAAAAMRWPDAKAP
jgi:Alpha/beta hydrolase domain